MAKKKDAGPTRIPTIQYVPPRTAACFPPAGPLSLWVAEHGCERLTKRLEALWESAAHKLHKEAEKFMGDMKLIFQRRCFGEKPLENLYTSPLGGLELVTAEEFCKIRARRWDLVLALRTARDLDEESPEPIFSLLEQVLCFPLKNWRGKRLHSSKLLDFWTPRRASLLEIYPPEAEGFVRGRFEKLLVYCDGKLLLGSFVPFEFKEINLPPRFPAGFHCRTLHEPQGPETSSPKTVPPPTEETPPPPEQWIL
jgi:hypothetical protein